MRTFFIRGNFLEATLIILFSSSVWTSEKSLSTKLLNQGLILLVFGILYAIADSTIKSREDKPTPSAEDE